jgi:hypothetical protein
LPLEPEEQIDPTERGVVISKPGHAQRGCRLQHPARRKTLRSLRQLVTAPEQTSERGGQGFARLGGIEGLPHPKCSAGVLHLIRHERCFPDTGRVPSFSQQVLAETNGNEVGGVIGI